MIRLKRSAVVAVAAVAAMSLMTASCSKQTKAQKEAQTAAARGFETISTPVTELEELKKQLEAKLIPCGIGVGESTDETVARNISSDAARTEIANSIAVQVQRLSESYAQNVDSEAKMIWEEGVRQLTNEKVRGTKNYQVLVQYNKDMGRYKIYTLMVLDPKLFKDAIAQATSRDEELELRVKKDDMMRKLDENIQAYDDKYRGKAGTTKTVAAE